MSTKLIMFVLLGYLFEDLDLVGVGWDLKIIIVVSILWDFFE